jgi:ElaB/YqjD/DUF883 family membrane-anchored ribosome-binding protein
MMNALLLREELIMQNESKSPAASTVHAGIDKIAATAKEAALSAPPVIDRVKNNVHNAIDTTADAAAGRVAAMRDCVERHPFKSVGIAVAVGFVVGRVLF